MINLLPPTAYKKIVLEYWVRVITIGLLFIGTALIFAIVALVPAYFLIDVQIKSIETNVSQSSEKVATYDVSASELEIATANAQLLTNVTVTPFTEYQNTIERLTGNSITVSALRFNRSDKKPATITIDGVATNRQTLATFRDALDAEVEFIKVDLPISNLIKDKDIPFSIQVQTSSSSLQTP
jgi:hypothetical protein